MIGLPFLKYLSRRPRMTFALVIPVWNDAAGLARLLESARKMGCFDQFIVVDDGSDTPVTVPNSVQLLRHDTPRGGGVARNTGLDAVTTSHVLFFDADDLLTEECPYLLADLAGEKAAFDFCLFRHADSRITADGDWGQMPWDEGFWQTAQLGWASLQEAPATTWHTLAQTANYPWNKVYRTAFLRDHGIGCAATAVHQDIPLHWLGFFAAARILVSGRVVAWHHVSATGDRLTNRSGAERLQVFAALTPVAQAATPEWLLVLARFVPGLVDWGADRIDPALLPDLRRAERVWLRTHISPVLDTILTLDPDLAADLHTRMGTP